MLRCFDASQLTWERPSGAWVMESTNFTTSALSSVKNSTNSFWEASENLQKNSKKKKICGFYCQDHLLSKSRSVKYQHVTTQKWTHHLLQICTDSPVKCEAILRLWRLCLTSAKNADRVLAFTASKRWVVKASAIAHQSGGNGPNPTQRLPKLFEPRSSARIVCLKMGYPHFQLHIII